MNIRPITICCCFFLLLASLNVSAQNKDIEKAKEKLKEAYQQKDPSKKNDLVQKAMHISIMEI
jgi:ABC-type protease/lipase transport system fused ATPase/permease subunit